MGNRRKRRDGGSRTKGREGRRRRRRRGEEIRRRRWRRRRKKKRLVHGGLSSPFGSVSLRLVISTQETIALDKHISATRDDQVARGLGTTNRSVYTRSIIYAYICICIIYVLYIYIYAYAYTCVH